MRRLPRPAAALIGSAVPLATAHAGAQLPSAEERAFAAVDAAAAAFERASESRVHNTSSRVSSLIYGSGFLAAGVASQAMDRVRGRLAAAQERARAACASIGPPPAPARR